jgi:GntR family transcriptional regulator
VSTNIAPNYMENDHTTHLWQQVADAVKAEIAASSAPGRQLPSEASQGARFGVSRVTLRQALLHLQQAGLIESRPGRGWFVIERKRDPLSAGADRRTIFEPPGKLMSFSDMGRSRGLVPDSVVLERRVRSASFEEAETLSIAPGAKVLLLRRLRRLNGLAVAVDDNLIPMYILPEALDMDFATNSLHAAFCAADASPNSAETEVDAIVADKRQARLLEVNEGFPLLRVRQAIFDDHGRAIEQGVITYRSDRYRYRSKLRA